MSNPYRDKLLSIGIISKRTRAEVTEGTHASGIRYKVTTDDSGTTVDHDLGHARVDARENPGPATSRHDYRPGPVTLADVDHV